MASLDVLRSLEANFKTRLDLQRKLATGKKINVPSDGPADAVVAYQLHSDVRKAEQYTRNAAQVRDWLDAQDSSMGLVTDALQRARDLAVRGASDTVSPEERKYIADEVEQIFAHVVQVANGRSGGRYLFGGSKTGSAPFLVDGTYVGNGGTLSCEVAEGVFVETGLDGGAVFGPAFAALKKLSAALTGGSAADVSAAIEDIDGAVDNLLRYRTEVGAKRNRADSADMATERASYTAQELLATVEDADLPLVATQLAAAEVGYRAALKAGSYLVRTSLLDYLK